MLTFRVIACLDVRDGRVVKGVQFSALQDSGDPAARAELYADQGADEIVMLDVSATPEGRETALDTVAEIRSRIGIPLSVGGGVRSVEDAARLLESGADKVCVNSAAVRDPGLIERLAARFGRQCIVVAIDARPSGSSLNDYEILVRSGQEPLVKCPIEWARQATSLGAGEVLLTSWDRDGTGQGYDVSLLGRVAEQVKVPVIASGGAQIAQHLVWAHDVGAHAALVASMLHSDETSVRAIKDELARHEIEVRR